MIDLIHISIPHAGGYALLGYLVVFMGLALLMCVILLLGRIMRRAFPAAAPSPPEEVSPAAPAAKAAPAPGSAGKCKLYNTDPREAAVVMAIVANTLGKPLNELRFISIREVKEDEV